MGICEGRVVIVTGGGRGIGRGHALEFARQGAKVVVNDLGKERDGSGNAQPVAQQVVDEIKAMGGEAVANPSDVSDWDAAKEMIDQAYDEFGKLDVLVNNAGILRDRMLFNMDEAEWDAVIRVHLKGTFCPTRHAAREVARAREGRRGARQPDHQHDVDVRAVRERRDRRTTARRSPASRRSRSSRRRRSRSTASR